MTTYSTETPVNGHDPNEPPFAKAPLPSSRGQERRANLQARRAEDRADRREEAEEKRRDREHKRRLKTEAKNAKVSLALQRKAERQKMRAKARKDRRARLDAMVVRLSHHMPLWGLPVVLVSLVVGWTGQAGAAAHLGMSWTAPGVPVLTEGMTLTFAGLTGQAIEQKRPYRWLMRATWTTAVVAASINGAGHLIEDSSAAGIYRACAYAGASLAALILWWVVMRSKRAAVSGRTAEDIARWKRLRRRHPILVRRARRIADNTGLDLDAAYAKAWERANGAAPGEPSIREIRASRRASFRRAQALAWDGRTRFSRTVPAPAAVVPTAVEPEPETVPEPVAEDVPEVIPAPYLPVALAVPGPDGQWIAHRVPVHPLTASRGLADTGSETATTRFPQGQEPLPAPSPDAPEAEGGTQSDEAQEQVREKVADDRLAKARALVDAAAEEGKNLKRHPSNRQMARHLGCRPGTAREFLTAVLAERGITR
ncbi:hypothetical protein SAMN04490357_7681 [Streptomyces misionensis]|uniref:DUF2637 domain-containing protein n=1 Tax=Streptomyces misionensis TaxID=67331 RepID=A0A1H5K3S6_9ACTN|nr:hypothetical protein [Streptomyces misionensis]SEE59117.1 hypothetical protein SAMN04490357_7681 [Streptomyces misionensis]